MKDFWSWFWSPGWEFRCFVVVLLFLIVAAGVTAVTVPGRNQGNTVIAGGLAGWGYAQRDGSTPSPPKPEDTEHGPSCLSVPEEQSYTTMITQSETSNSRGGKSRHWSEFERSVSECLDAGWSIAGTSQKYHTTIIHLVRDPEPED